MKSNKGVTLVALVVTIIVLLILAGVTINMVAGQNGIMTKASTAKTSTMVSTFREAVQTAVSALAADEQEAAAMGSDGPTAARIKAAIEKDINNSVKNVTITIKFKDNAGTEITDMTKIPTTAEINVVDQSGKTTLSSANISSLYVKVTVSDWTISDGVVTYKKAVDSKTNTTFQ